MARRGVLGAAALAMTGLLAAAPVSSAVGAATQGPADVLSRPLSGVAAVQVLGNRLDTVAGAHGMSGSKLEHLLRTDPTVWVDRSGAPFVKDTALPTVADTEVVARAPFPNSRTFLLHSRPGANRTIYLDFNGQTVSGTAWNTSGVTTAAQPAFDTNGAPGTFSQSEIDVIQSVWQRVSEDYAPFNVDVTTEDPGTAALNRTSSTDTAFGTRVLITPGAQAWAALCSSSCGGIAYIGVFNFVGNANYSPAWVFPQALANSAKYIAEAASHEAGHNLGLSHDGTAAVAYYAGQQNWAPIMGVGYNEPITQWSKGEYTGANNTEDDIAVIQATGAPLRADDRGNTRATAFVLGAATSAKGVIERRADVDYYKFTRSCAVSTKVSVLPTAVAPNVDLKLTLLSSTGAVLGTANPVSGQTSFDKATGISAAITRTLGTGTYFLAVDGVNNGTGATGYSDYGSLGQYTVRVPACP